MVESLRDGPVGPKIVRVSRLRSSIRVRVLIAAQKILTPTIDLEAYHACGKEYYVSLVTPRRNAEKPLSTAHRIACSLCCRSARNTGFGNGSLKALSRRVNEYVRR